MTADSKNVVLVVPKWPLVAASYMPVERATTQFRVAISGIADQDQSWPMSSFQMAGFFSM